MQLDFASANIRAFMDSGFCIKDEEGTLKIPTITEYMKFFDVSKWWQHHKEAYPLLYLVASRYLIIPLSNAGQEREFSVMSRNMTKLQKKTLAKLWFKKMKFITFKHYRARNISARKVYTDENFAMAEGKIKRNGGLMAGDAGARAFGEQRGGKQRRRNGNKRC